MNQVLIIRHAVLHDLPSLLHLANQLSDTVQVSEQYLQEHLSALLADDNHCILVATQEGMVVGYISGYFHQAIYASAMVAYIDEVVVDSGSRARSIGSQMMQKFEKLCQEKGCRLISLATFGAKDFYEKLGYRTKASYFKKSLP
ncbi:Ribosomal protein S18 acetylase RimI [Dyadobacter sp. SG02]|uniref:GNAT family N-acetyltransferase n=1 Tax=Dyadobacter sp. SG02 TaxID=1855291 RepID=UPI0008CC5F1B|nr:GNAT family N-acetyltransferase [Dyadobacter sp. SG02]SEJ36279.1 Ribosomal protein S18 acetylase RimI [Dyadobacter sp. SG02]